MPKKHDDAIESAHKTSDFGTKTPNTNSQMDGMSNELENVAVRTRTPKLLIGIVLVVIGTLVVLSVIQRLTDNRQRLVAPKGTITIEIADTPESRKQGLSFRESIGDDEGVLFVFDSLSVDNCFWMKDMKFPIDMIWMNQDKEVITIEKFIEPDTYPETFCPNEPAKYGLEIQAHKTLDMGIEKGKKLLF